MRARDALRGIADITVVERGGTTDRRPVDAASMSDTPPRARAGLYLRFGVFVLPLVITIIIQETSVQWIAAGLARMPFPVELLAAYGLAWGISNFLTGPLVYSKQMSLVLVERRQSFWQSLRFILLVAAAITALQAVLAVTEPGRTFLEQVHRIRPETAGDVRFMLTWMLAHPCLKGLANIMAGPLIRNRQTRYVSYGAVAGFLSVAAVTLIFLQHPQLRSQPVWLPVAALYVWQIAELALMIIGVVRHREAIWDTQPHASFKPGRVTLGAMFLFFWPLAGMVLLQEFSRPLINFFIARQPDGELHLAVIAVVYALGQWPYRWVNEIRNLAASFHREDPGFKAISRFSAAMALLSMAIYGALYWTPVREWILLTLMGVEPHLADLAGTPLRVYTFFAVAVAIRAYMQGVGLVERRTPSMLPSAITRQFAVVLTLLALPPLGISGASMGVAALLSGFLVEALTLAAALRGPALLSRLQAATAGTR